MDIELKYSYPQLTDASIVKLEEILFRKFGYPSLPQDYKDFLLKNNGGFVIPGYVPETNSFDSEYGRAVFFDTSLVLVEADNEALISRLLSFMGVWMDEMNENEIENGDLPDIVCINDYLENHVNVLPDKMMLIACCNYPDVYDGIFISLDDEDYGSIYYHYELWSHPDKFIGTYFDDKEKEILSRYGVTHMDELDETSSRGMARNVRIAQITICEDSRFLYRLSRYVPYQRRKLKV